MLDLVVTKFKILNARNKILIKKAMKVIKSFAYNFIIYTFKENNIISLTSIYIYIYIHKNNKI